MKKSSNKASSAVKARSGNMRQAYVAKKAGPYRPAPKRKNIG